MGRATCHRRQCTPTAVSKAEAALHLTCAQDPLLHKCMRTFTPWCSHSPTHPPTHLPATTTAFPTGCISNCVLAPACIQLLDISTTLLDISTT
jgi:hypothetical protein